MPVNRGDIYWVNIPARNPSGREIAKKRPCIIVSIPALSRARSTVPMVPLTSNGKESPPIAIFAPSAGDQSVAVCDQMFAVDKMRIENRIGALSPHDLDNVGESLKAILGL